MSAIFTWTAFTRDSLINAKLNGLTFENSQNLLVSGTGSLETQALERPFERCIVSWNALTPSGSHVLLEVRVRFGTRWSKYLRLALWSADPLNNTSFDDADEGVFLETDTIICKSQADALQIRVSLDGQAQLTGLAATFSSDEDVILPVPPPTTKAIELDVPMRSQMIYPNGGRVWCSPTSITMLLEYWSHQLGLNLADSVPETAKAVWDVKYNGAGNWAFNMAFVGSKGLQGFVSHLSSFVETESYLTRGVPMALSIGWKEGELIGAPIGHSGGHLVVLRGFTKEGDPIVNDPAYPSDDSVRVIYKRAELERAWLGHSGGIVYIVQPNAYTSFDDRSCLLTFRSD
jgi:hypothetical protein